MIIRIVTFTQVFGSLSTSLLPRCQHQNITGEESADVCYSGLHFCHYCQHPQVSGNHREYHQPNRIPFLAHYITHYISRYITMKMEL